MRAFLQACRTTEKTYYEFDPGYSGAPRDIAHTVRRQHAPIGRWVLVHAGYLIGGEMSAVQHLLLGRAKKVCLAPSAHLRYQC